MEEGQKRFDELGDAPEVKPLEPVELPKKPTRKTVKRLVPKNKQ